MPEQAPGGGGGGGPPPPPPPRGTRRPRGGGAGAGVREPRPLPGSRCLLRGDLTLHGVSRSLEVEVLVRAPDPDTLEVEGEKTIDMRDFNLAPPHFLIFKVEPTVRIRPKLVGRRRASNAPHNRTGE